MARSAALVAVALACVLLAVAPRESQALTCGNVASSIVSCLQYVRGGGPLVAACCNGIRSLNAAAKSTADRQTACNCLKSTAGSIPGFKPALAAGLPGKCGVSVPYAISTSIDCSKVK